MKKETVRKSPKSLTLSLIAGSNSTRFMGFTRLGGILRVKSFF